MFVYRIWITGHTHNITCRDSCRPPRNSRRSSLYITYAYTPRRTREIKQTPCQAPLNLPRTYEPNTNPLPQPHTYLHTRPWQHHTLSHHSRCSQARPFCLHCDSSPRLINALCLVVFTLLLSSRVNTLTHPPQKPLNRFLLLSLNRVQSSPPSSSYSSKFDVSVGDLIVGT